MIEAPVVKDITSIYDKAITPTTEEANKQLLIEARDKALYEVTNIGATRMRDSQDIYTIKALRELFLTIKNRNDNNDAIDLTTLMFNGENGDEVKVSRQLHNSYRTINKAMKGDEAHPEDEQRQLNKQQDSAEFLPILSKIFNNYMSIEIFNMFKSYAIITTTTRECTSQNAGVVQPVPRVMVNPTLMLRIPTQSSSIQQLIDEFQEVEVMLNADTVKTAGDACYELNSEGKPEGKVKTIKDTVTSSNDSTTLIIILTRISRDPDSPNVLLKSNNTVVPEPNITLDRKNYTLQGCILHGGDTIKSGHYVYIIYDVQGQPKQVFDDSITYNKEDTTGLYTARIDLIDTNGVVFLYKNLAKIQEIANQAAVLARPFIEHAQKRVDQLRYQLHTKPEANVVIAGSNGKHNLGTGLAKRQWIDYYVESGNYPINVIISAQRLFVEKLNELFKELKDQFNTRVTYNPQISKELAINSTIVVWGANSENCYGEDNVKIEHDVQEDHMESHGPGVFGIITTPVKGKPPAKESMKGFASNPEHIRTSEQHNIETHAVPTPRTQQSSTVRGATPELLSETSEPLNKANFGVGLDPELRPGDDETEYTQRKDILRDTLTLFSRNMSKYKEFARKNLERWSKNQTKTKPSPCILTVSESDWGTKALEVTRLYGTIFACLNMANSTNPGGAYTAGVAAQEENMFRRTDCHFSLTHPNIIDEVYRNYTEEMTELIEGIYGEVYLDTEAPRICIKGAEMYTKKGGIITISGYDMLKDEEIFPFYEMRSAAQNIKESMLFDEEEMTKRIHAQINTLKKNNIRHVVLGAFGCGDFHNPPQRTACIYRDKLKQEKEYFDVIEFPIYYAGHGEYNLKIFKEALEAKPKTDKAGNTVTSWIYNTTDFRVSDEVDVEANIEYKNPENYGGDSTSVLNANDITLTDTDINTNTDMAESHKKSKRIFIMKQTLDKFKERAAELFGFAQLNFTNWQSIIQARPKIKKSIQVIVENVDWGLATLKYTKEYGKIFACLNMANADVPGGGYIKGMGAQEENMFRRTNCHFTIKSYDLIDDEQSSWDSRKYSKLKKDIIEGKDGCVYFNWKYPRICIRGPEDNTKIQFGYKFLPNDEIFPFYELRCAAIDRRVNGKPPTDTKMTKEDIDKMRKRINAQLETLRVHGVRHVILGAFGCGIFKNDPKTIANLYKEAIEARKIHFDVIVFAILHEDPNTNFEEFSKIFSNQSIIDTTTTTISTPINYTNPENYGQNIYKIYKTDGPVDNPFIRRRVLLDTFNKFGLTNYESIANKNLELWKTKVKSKPKSTNGIRILNMDWGDATLKFTKEYGETFACLNMANSLMPGGAYNLGGSGQEENMFRRTNCHFTIERDYLEPAATRGELQKYWKYKQYFSNMIDGKTGKVYLSKPRHIICIKGADTLSLDLGYQLLGDDDIFSFYEMRSAPLDRRSPLPPNRNMNEDKEEIKKRIKAQFNTLIAAKIRHVILGDFGCSTLKNNPFTIANIYKQVIESVKHDFDVIVFAIPNADYNNTIHQVFNDTFTKSLNIDEEIAEEFLMLARDRITELRNILNKRSTAKVKIAANTITDTTHNLAAGSAQKLWTTKYGYIGEAARQIFINKLGELFGALKRDFPTRVSYGRLDRKEASLDHYLVWGAFADNYESTLERVKTSEQITGNSQATNLSPHKIGLFGIIAAPGVSTQK